MSVSPAQPDTLYDTIIVGAGLSGICAAWHHQRAFPEHQMLILEGRDDLGGTWDLFRYPGVRSDSDMPTLGYTFKPWLGRDAIASGPKIKAYIRATAEDAKLSGKIAFGHQLEAADWDSTTACWTLTVRRATETLQLRCRFLFLCTGYYDYEQGYTPALPGREAFDGQWIHPQHWPEDVNLKGRRVAIIGSGATAVTLVPSLAAEGARVTMVQRTPSYVAELPARDAFSRWCHRWLGARVAHAITRWKNIAYTLYIYQAARRFPGLVRRQLMGMVRERVGHVLDVDEHFNPPYNPWDQRLCLAPDGDFFDAIVRGDASVVTDHIQGFESDALMTASGERVPADIIVCATGLQLKVAGGAHIRVDGERVQANQRLSYKGAMLGGVPNFALTMGYTNASWTLKCELIARWVVRLRRHMHKHGYSVVRPDNPPVTDSRALLPLSAGYVQRAERVLPRQGLAAPWTVHQNYLRDLVTFRWSPIRNKALYFSSTGERQSSTAGAD